MIEPFEPGQVREVDGKRIVSYGTSSYGYDIRCSREFKIFTNINSTIVDPKAFDAGSFVDFTGDVCIIPPNSFALARTVEYFRIPRNVLTICLGKCVTGHARGRCTHRRAGLDRRHPRRRAHGRARRVEDGDRRTCPRSFRKAGSRCSSCARARACASRRPPIIRSANSTAGRRWTRCVRATGSRFPREIPVFGSTPLPDWEASLLGLMISEGQCRTPGHSPTFTNNDAALVALLARSVAAGGWGA